MFFINISSKNYIVKLYIVVFQQQDMKKIDKGKLKLV